VVKDIWTIETPPRFRPLDDRGKFTGQWQQAALLVL
jgi:hypothetical protein